MQRQCSERRILSSTECVTPRQHTTPDEDSSRRKGEQRGGTPREEKATRETRRADRQDARATLALCLSRLAYSVVQFVLMVVSCE